MEHEGVQQHQQQRRRGGAAPDAERGYNDLVGMVSGAASGRNPASPLSTPPPVQTGPAPTFTYAPVRERVRPPSKPFTKVKKVALPTGGGLTLMASNTPNSFANHAALEE